MQITPYMWQTLHQPIPQQQHFSGTQLLLSHSKHMERTELKKGCSFKGSLVISKLYLVPVSLKQN
jgi:hypothetical protein